jgi:hypothetical protein
MFKNNENENDDSIIPLSHSEFLVKFKNEYEDLKKSGSQLKIIEKLCKDKDNRINENNLVQINISSEMFPGNLVVALYSTDVGLFGRIKGTNEFFRELSNDPSNVSIVSLETGNVFPGGAFSNYTERLKTFCLDELKKIAAFEENKKKRIAAFEKNPKKDEIGVTSKVRRYLMPESAVNRPIEYSQSTNKKEEASASDSAAKNSSLPPPLPPKPSTRSDAGSSVGKDVLMNKVPPPSNSSNSSKSSKSQSSKSQSSKSQSSKSQSSKSKSKFYVPRPRPANECVSDGGKAQSSKPGGDGTQIQSKVDPLAVVPPPERWQVEKWDAERDTFITLIKGTSPTSTDRVSDKSIDNSFQQSSGNKMSRSQSKNKGVLDKRVDDWYKRQSSKSGDGNRIQSEADSLKFVPSPPERGEVAEWDAERDAFITLIKGTSPTSTDRVSAKSIGDSSQQMSSGGKQSQSKNVLDKLADNQYKRQTSKSDDSKAKNLSPAEKAVQDHSAGSFFNSQKRGIGNSAFDMDTEKLVSSERNEEKPVSSLQSVRGTWV